jgi:Tfp pilus assembly protein PilN
MMIHVNLHPRRGKRPVSEPGESPFAGLGARVAGAVTDRYLAGAVVAVAGACAAVAFLYASQARAESELAAREEVAARDSARYAVLIAAQKKASARRDSLAAQLQVIAVIDSNRYVWAHLLDEMSRALPAYTWLTSVQQTSAPPRPPGADSAAVAAGAGKGAKPAADTAAAGAAPAVATRFRLMGHTVDIQALTQFMRDLEASPFVANVQLARSEAVVTDGKDVTEFTLDAEFQVAARSALRTETIIVQAR